MVTLKKIENVINQREICLGVLLNHGFNGAYSR